MIKGAQKIGLTLLLTAFLAAGAAIAIAAVKAYHAATAASAWPTTVATITESQISGMARKKTLRVRYEYVVDGRRFRSTRIALRDRIMAKKISERGQLYAIGRTVTVYYSPENPAVALLEVGVFWPGLAFHLLGTLLLVFVGGGGLYLILFKK